MNGDQFMDWGPDHVTDWRRPRSDVWRLRWHGLTQPAAKGIWQVCLFPPPMSTKSWDRPPGLVASGDVEVPPGGDATIFEIPFREFAPEPPNARSDDDPVSARGRRATVTLSPAVVRALSSERSSSQPRRVAVSLPDPITYYVRVVQVDRAGRPTGSPSNPVSIRYGTPEDPAKSVGFQEVLLAIHEREQEEREWSARAAAVRIEDVEWYPERRASIPPPYRMIVAAELPAMPWKKGDRVKLWPEEEDVWDKVTEAIGDVTGFVGDALEWVATAYDDIKSDLAEFTAGLVSELPGCDADCKAAVQVACSAAVEAGLAAMGMPPTLPTFNELRAMGEGYLVETLAQQATAASGVPVPRYVAEKVVDEFGRLVEDAAGGGSGGTMWLRPDPACQARPALAVVHVRNTGPQESPRALALSVSVPGLYIGRQLALPALRPGAALQIPVLLPERDLDFHKDAARKELGWNPDWGSEGLGDLWARLYRSGNGKVDVALGGNLQRSSVPTGTEPLVSGKGC